MVDCRTRKENKLYWCSEVLALLHTASNCEVIPAQRYLTFHIRNATMVNQGRKYKGAGGLEPPPPPPTFKSREAEPPKNNRLDVDTTGTRLYALPSAACNCAISPPPPPPPPPHTHTHTLFGSCLHPCQLTMHIHRAVGSSCRVVRSGLVYVFAPHKLFTL